MKAFVSVNYKDDGPSFAGASAKAVDRADVLEVEAKTPRDAEKEAYRKTKENPMAGMIRARFMRWVEQ